MLHVSFYLCDEKVQGRMTYLVNPDFGRAIIKNKIFILIFILIPIYYSYKLTEYFVLSPILSSCNGLNVRM